MLQYSDEELASYFRAIMLRYTGASPEAFVGVLCPILVPIHTLDKTIIRVTSESHHRASFTVEISNLNREVIQRGRTGKFIPGDFRDGAGWREIAKGRIIEVDNNAQVALGEVYVSGPRSNLETALEQLHEHSLLEIDQYGAAAKILSGLAEYELARQAREAGYAVERMPEDMAKHLGAYANYDFRFRKEGVTKKVEVKSIWGTNTRFARLIHSTTSAPKGDPSTWTASQTLNHYPTSSCKFITQDIFAVSLFLRTGSIQDFAFARSVSKADRPYGLPFSARYPDHVNQNPSLEIGDGTWFATIDEVWELQ